MNQIAEPRGGSMIEQAREDDLLAETVLRDRECRNELHRQILREDAAIRVMAHLMRSVGMLQYHDMKGYHSQCKRAAESAVLAADCLMSALEKPRDQV